jgi:hypothetical protein
VLILNSPKYNNNTTSLRGGPPERRRLDMDLFQALTILFAFGMFLLTLLAYIDKRK